MCNRQSKAKYLQRHFIVHLAFITYAQTLHVAISSPGKKHMHSCPSISFRRKCDLSNQAPFFPCPIIPFCCPCNYCWRFWWWTKVSVGTLTSLWLRSPNMKQSVLHCVLSPLCGSQKKLFQQFALQ